MFGSCHRALSAEIVHKSEGSRRDTKHSTLFLHKAWYDGARLLFHICPCQGWGRVSTSPATRVLSSHCCCGCARFRIELLLMSQGTSQGRRPHKPALCSPLGKPTGEAVAVPCLAPWLSLGYSCCRSPCSSCFLLLWSHACSQFHCRGGPAQPCKQPHHPQGPRAEWQRLELK